MNKHLVFLKFSLTLTALILALPSLGRAELPEVYCTISSSNRLDCQWVEKDVRRKMTAGDISKFIDKAQVAAYMTVVSRMGLERVFMIDGESNAFAKVNEAKKSASISEINKAKSDVFNDIETRAIKLSDDLDLQSKNSDLVKYDSSIAVDKAKLDKNELVKELDTYRKTDPNFIKSQQAAGGEGDNLTATAGSRHRFTLAYENVGYNGNFSFISRSGYKSNDNLGAYLSYRYDRGTWLFKADAEIYNVYSNFNKGSSGGSTNFAGTDSSKQIYNLWLRGNYCYSMGASSRWCPGLSVGYDQFAVMGFKTLTFSGTNPTSASVLEMQSVTDLVAALDIMFEYPLYRSIVMSNRLGYVYGTGGLGTQNNNKSTKNFGYFGTAVIEWPMWQGFAMNFGIEYFSRVSTMETSGGNNASRTVVVDNNALEQYTSRVGFVWSWGEN